MPCEFLPFEAQAKTCSRCGKDLAGTRRTRWCSNTCRQEWWVQHDWNAARKLTIERDARVCQICGVTTRSLWDKRWREHPDAPPEPPPWSSEAFAAGGGQAGYGNTYRAARAAYEVTWKAFLADYAVDLSPEVDHIVPRVGRGYGLGCHNHQSNLRTLCHQCHVEVTAQQRRARGRSS